MGKKRVDSVLLGESIRGFLDSSIHLYRDSVIADRLEELFNDACEEDQVLLTDALDSFITAFLKQELLSQPRFITLTPDGAIIARWEGFPEGFVCTSVEFPSGKAVTICHGVRTEWNFYEKGESCPHDQSPRLGLNG